MLTRVRVSCALVLGAVLGSSPAAAQTLGCTSGGGGGTIPATGTGGGTYPSVLPTAPSVFTLGVASLPSGATVVTEVRLIGLTHTWTSDCQFVLQDPGGGNHNILCRPGTATTGFSCDFNGNYTVLAACTGGLSMPSACTGTAVLAPGAYDQYTGRGGLAWPSGTNGIFNTPLDTIPAAPGTWSLVVYDWASGDSGALTSFEVCFGTPTPPSPPSAAPTLTSPTNAATLLNPVTLTWSAVSCATSYDVDLDGVVTNVGSTSFSAPPLAPGVHTWSARAVNSSGASAYAAPFTFTIPLPPPPSICVPLGGGGAVPAAGTGGTGAVWPGTLPATPFTNTYAVTVPAGSTQLMKLEVNFATQHTWVGDLLMVLTDPSGGMHNILHRVGSTGTGAGLNCDLNGAYSLYESAGLSWPTTCPASTDVPIGDYNQSFGAWPSGTNGIFNTPLSAIPIASGNWTLTIYDWAGGDSGVLANWQLCFDSPVTSVQAGSDLWNTPGLGCTYQEFPNGSLAADFFGVGGNPWPGGGSMFVGFVGTPLTGSGMVGNVDTIVERLAPANIGACGTQDTVPIQIKALSLESFKPVIVNFGGNNNSKYDVVACLENVAQPIGSMTIRREHANGGTFDSTLPVIVRLTFNKISGASGVASATINNALITFQNPGSSGISACWSYNDGGLGIPASPGGSGVDCGGNAFSFPATSNFYAGVCYPGADCINPGAPPEPQLTRENAVLAQHCILPVALPPQTMGYCYCGPTQPPGAPCGNFDANAGCANSTGQGMRLDVVGNTSVQTDTVVISVTGGPPSGTALLIWSDSATFGHFGDGQLCVAQPRRAGTRLLISGAATWTNVAFSSQVPLVGGVRTYQVWYRNSVAFCTPDTFNMSNAYQVLWMP